VNRQFLILLLLSIVTFKGFSLDSIKSAINIDFVVDPVYEEETIPRGANIRLIRYFIPNLYWGFSFKIINKNYTSLIGLTGFDLKINSNLSIPFNIGYGLKIKSFSLSPDNQEGIDSFIYALSGLQWNVDEQWGYTIYASYDYDFLNSNNKLLLSLGIMYKY